MAEESRRAVAIRLPLVAWRFLEREADVLERSLSEECSDLILTALQAQGMELPPRNEHRTTEHRTTENR